ncbi:hypothetical protein [Pseudomonas sp. NPDC089534]|uniref:hypothetical protein n=1 Tax=Pseudomonas sp. NPDC089534 TaxID=3364468 RepID=UPI0037FAAC7A
MGRLFCAHEEHLYLKAYGGVVGSRFGLFLSITPHSLGRRGRPDRRAGAHKINGGGVNTVDYSAWADGLVVNLPANSDAFTLFG